MFAKILVILMLIASPALAMNKCVIDGKTHYQRAPCPEGTNKEIKGSFSVNSTSGVRQNIAIENEQKAIAAEKAAKQVESQKQAAEDKRLKTQLNTIEAMSIRSAIRK